jgi:hypothetical protein
MNSRKGWQQTLAGLLYVCIYVSMYVRYELVAEEGTVSI